MAKQALNLGTSPTGAGGDTPRSAFTKIEANFTDLYALWGGAALPSGLPINKGGTGAITAAAAAAALGLGTANSPTFSGLTSTLDVQCRGYKTHAGINSSSYTNTFNVAWNGGAQMWIDATNVGTMTLTTSDYRIKRNIESIGDVDFLKRISDYRIVTYQHKKFDVWEKSDVVHQGLIAHEAQEVNPLAVTNSKDAVDEDGNVLIQQLEPMALITDLMGAIVQLRGEVESLKAAMQNPA